MEKKYKTEVKYLDIKFQDKYFKKFKNIPMIANDAAKNFLDPSMYDT